MLKESGFEKIFSIPNTKFLKMSPQYLALVVDGINCTSNVLFLFLFCFVLFSDFSLGATRFLVCLKPVFTLQFL